MQLSHNWNGSAQGSGWGRGDLLSEGPFSASGSFAASEDRLSLCHRCGIFSGIWINMQCGGLRIIIRNELQVEYLGDKIAPVVKKP